MKQLNLLLLIIFFAAVQNSWAAENEPNDTKAQANALILNGTDTGTFNSASDVDWWVVNITDGDLYVGIGILNCAAINHNCTGFHFTVYTDDGTTLVAASQTSVSLKGLIAGTYYVVANNINSAEAGSTYILQTTFSGSLNDIEPNDNPAQAIVLPLNAGKSGNVGYSNPLKRDTSDWYKVTTNADGLLRINASPANGKTIRIYLYDNNGTTLLNSDYSSGTATISEDGLAAGTYYIRVFCFYNNEFAPYNLSDSLVAYNYAKDADANEKPYEAKTINSNGSIDGHVGFYYNNLRDSVDWFKINYTGSGNLDFTINQETLKSGGNNSLRFQVYKDTSASPIHSSFSSAASRNVNLTALTQGYYWIKIYPYYNSEFSSYSFSNSFTQINVAKIKSSSYDTAAVCGSVNKIVFRCSGSNAPYTVQLYRYGVLYGNALVTSKTATFKNLPTGSYYATVFGDGATGASFGKSKNVSLEPIPADLNTTNITNKQAQLNWTMISCASYYSIQYKIHGTTDWTIKKSTGNVNNYLLKNLSPATTYDWRMATSDSANGISATGIYSDSITFTTSAGFDNVAINISENANSKNNNTTISVFPNPASNYFIINLATHYTQKVNAMLFDITGKQIWTSGLINSESLNGKRVAITQYKQGIYTLKITDDKGKQLNISKLVISK